MFTTRVSLRHTTVFTYSLAATPLGQSERAYYLSYFIIVDVIVIVTKRIILPQQEDLPII